MNHRCVAGRSNRSDEIGLYNWQKGENITKMGNCFHTLLNSNITIQHRERIHWQQVLAYVTPSIVEKQQLFSSQLQL